MADITKCSGSGCTLKDSCKRFIAPSNPNWQAWQGFYHLPKPCEFYYPISTISTTKENRK